MSLTALSVIRNPRKNVDPGSEKTVERQKPVEAERNIVGYPCKNPKRVCM